MLTVTLHVVQIDVNQKTEIDAETATGIETEVEIVIVIGIEIAIETPMIDKGEDAVLREADPEIVVVEETVEVVVEIEREIAKIRTKIDIESAIGIGIVTANVIEIVREKEKEIVEEKRKKMFQINLLCQKKN